MKKSISVQMVLVGLLGLSSGLAACAKKSDAGSQQVASTIKDGLGCQNFQSLFMDSLYHFLDAEKSKPSAVELKASFSKVFSSQQQGPQARELQQAIFDLIDLVLSHPQTEQMSAKDLLHFLIQLEMGNQSTLFHQTQVKALQTSSQRVNALAKALDVSCQTPNPPVVPAPPLDPQQGASQKQMPLSLFGAYFSMATAYQSCQSIDLPEMSSNTEDVQGIRKGKDIGGGFQREYASVPDIVRTHYYIRQQNFPQGCFRLDKQPLVYDFGGEPSVEPQRLNFFANAGPGGTALGIDCSSFVSSALATAGLRYSPGLANKPIFVRQVSYDFIDPQASGWKCFDRIQVDNTKSIVPGDIVAVQGHVVMIDRVGEDPFGLGGVQSKADCSSLSYRNFDFSVIQSSPSKRSIGINKFAARDYLPESEKMQAAFGSYARSACLAKFDGKTYKPASSEFGIIRHNGTEACRAPRVELANQACIKDCSAWR